MTTLRTNITNEVRLIQSVFNEEIEDEAEKMQLETLLKTILDNVDMYACRGLLNIEKQIQHAKDVVQKQKEIIQSGVDLLQCMSLVTGVHACPICLSAEVKVFCIPCGHTFCDTCLKTKKCYICRAFISDVQKLYYV